MAISKEEQAVLEILSKLSEKEKGMIQDSYRRLLFTKDIRQMIIDLYTAIRDIMRLHMAGMDTSSTEKSRKSFEERDDMIEIFNDRIKEVRSKIKTVFHNVLEDDDIKDILKLVKEEKEHVAKHNVVELHDYQALLKTARKIDSLESKNEQPSADLKKLAEDIHDLMSDFKEEIALEGEMINLAEALKRALKRLHEIRKEQANLVMASLDYLQRLQLISAKDLFEKSRRVKLESTYSAIDLAMIELEKSIRIEKNEVIAVINPLLKKEFDIEGVFNHLIDETNKRLLDSEDVSAILSTMTSIVDGIDFLYLLSDYKDLFDKQAQKLIEKEYKHYKKMVKNIKKEAPLAKIDGLTGLFNRRYFNIKMIQLANDVKIKPDKQISLIFIDIDNFGSFNKIYGHPVGDDVLQTVSETLKRLLRRGQDFIYRYGGEEIVVVLPDTDLEGAKIVAEKMRKGIEDLSIKFPVLHTEARQKAWAEGKLKVIKDQKVYCYDPEKKVTFISRRGDPNKVIDVLKDADYQSNIEYSTEGPEEVLLTISLGVSNYPKNTNHTDKLCKLADDAEEEAKAKQGKNCIVVSSQMAI